nr:hypothetical protein CFP56_75706 [Quercus suber]
MKRDAVYLALYIALERRSKINHHFPGLRAWESALSEVRASGYQSEQCKTRIISVQFHESPIPGTLVVGDFLCHSAYSSVQKAVEIPVDILLVRGLKIYGSPPDKC